jgi:hypothetical protein
MGKSPEGTAEDFNRPSGTRHVFRSYPALKRWAIVGCPSGTNFSLNIRKALDAEETQLTERAEHNAFVLHPSEDFGVPGMVAPNGREHDIHAHRCSPSLKPASQTEIPRTDWFC